MRPAELVQQLQAGTVARRLSSGDVEFHILDRVINDNEVICAIVVGNDKLARLVVTTTHEQIMELERQRSATWYALPRELADQVDYQVVSIVCHGRYFFFITPLPQEVGWVIGRHNYETLTVIVDNQPNYFVVKLIPLGRATVTLEAEQQAIKWALQRIWQALKDYGIIDPQANMAEALIDSPPSAWHRYMVEHEYLPGDFRLRSVDSRAEADLEIVRLRESGVTGIRLGLVLGNEHRLAQENALTLRPAQSGGELFMGF